MKKQKGRNIFKNLFWSIKELCAFSKVYIILMISDSVLKGITPIVTLVLMQKMINEIQLQTRLIQDVVFLLVCISAFELFSVICQNIFTLKLENYERKFDTFFQTVILEKVSGLGCKDFENSMTYDLINRIQMDGNSGILQNVKTIFQIISLGISITSYIVIIINYNILLFGVVIVVPIIRYFFERKYNLLEYDTVKENTEPERKAAYISSLLTRSEDYKEIKMFSLFDYFTQRFKRIKSCIDLRFIKLNIKKMRILSIMAALEIIVDFLMTMYILIQTFNGALLIGQFVLYSNSIDNLKENVVSAFTELSSIYKTSAMVDQMREFFDMPKEEVNKNGTNIDEIKSIRLKNVSYKYKGKDLYTLKDINLTLERGDFAVVMGPNGSGKSTLMKIIMGIYHDYEGEIFVDEKNLKHINIDCYRGRISTLFQDYIKYENKIAENIWFGNLSYENDEQKIDEMLEKISLDEFKYLKDKELGYQFKEGRQVSIGQWQKLALGRAMIKNGDLCIFDEPNSSLDLLSEDTILKSIYKEAKNKISILIMHRFNNVVSKANKIIIINDGRIEDIGTHKELLKGGGTYFELYSIQNSEVQKEETIEKQPTITTTILKI